MLPWFWRLWGLYLPHDLFIFLFVSLADFLSFLLSFFFFGWILLRSPKEILTLLQVGMKFNWAGKSWTKTRRSFLCSVFTLHPATSHEYSELHWVLAWFSISVFFRFPSLAMALFTTYTRTQVEKHMHAHNVPHQHNSCWKGNLIVAPVMNIHRHLLPAESF